MRAVRYVVMGMGLMGYGMEEEMVAWRGETKYDFGPLGHYLDSVADFYGNLSMTIGDKDGPLFEYSNVNMTADVVLPLASGSKWPAVTALTACFANNNIDFDAKVSDYLPWWTSDASDSRSEVTLRHILSMTTGMIVDSDNATTAWERCSLFGGRTNATFDDCAKHMYLAVKEPYYAPGKKFLYSTFGFQWAAAVAQIIEGAPIGKILEKYVLEPAKMLPDCSWFDMDTFPLLGGGLQCNAAKMDRFNRAILNDALLPVKVRLEAETPQLTPSMYGDATIYYGPYCFGNWQLCLLNFKLHTPMPQQCSNADRHGHPGCNGYWNVVDRKRGVYLNLLPSYTCSPDNNWCDSPMGSTNCPALYGYSQTIFLAASRFLDDVLDYSSSSSSSSSFSHDDHQSSLLLPN